VTSSEACGRYGHYGGGWRARGGGSRAARTSSC
jgi:hypothetical protein